MSRRDILVLAPLPSDVRAALGACYGLIDLAHVGGGAGGDLSAFEVAVTTSVGGADCALLERLSGLRMLGCMGVGLDRIDLVAAARLGIMVRHTPDAVRTDTADMAVALVFAAVRRVAEADRFVRFGAWKASRMAPSRRVSGMAAGVVGLGAIGTLVAQRLMGCGLDVAYTGPRRKDNVPWPYIPSIEALASRSDVLVLCCPGGPATAGLVSAEVLRCLGSDGYVINVARGSVVDEGALLAALETGGIAGAGLDVFADEPALDPRFRALETVVLTPHYAAVTRQSREEMAATLLAAFDTMGPPGAQA